MAELTIGNLKIQQSTCWSVIQAYGNSAGDTLRYYDFAGGTAATPAHDGITLESIGRLAFFDARLSTQDATALMHAADKADWAMLPPNARLADADPTERGGIYDAAEDFYRTFLNVNTRIHASDVSKLLRLNRPDFFPVLDSPVRVLYADRATAAWSALDRKERPRSGKSYWPVIHEDVLEAQDSLATWRNDLRASGIEVHRSMATLSDLRLWDIVVRSLSSTGR